LTKAAAALNDSDGFFVGPFSIAPVTCLAKAEAVLIHFRDCPFAWMTLSPDKDPIV
jgi:hypothetical protein